MKYRNLSLILLSNTFACPLAWGQANFDIHAQGGLGTAQSALGADAKFKIDKVTLKARFDMEGVDRENLNQSEDKNFTLLRNGANYESRQEVEYKGLTLKGGLGLDYQINEQHKLEIEGSFDGQRHEGEGTRTEEFPNANTVSLIKTDIDIKQHDLNKTKLGAAYTYRTRRNGESLRVEYSADMLRADNNIEELENYPHVSASNKGNVLNSFVQQEDETRQQAGFTWVRPLAEGQKLTAGFRFEDTHFETDELQEIGKEREAEQFDYRNTAHIYRLGYEFRKGKIMANAQLDYMNTHQQTADKKVNTKLDDFVPMAMFRYQLNKEQALMARYGMRLFRPSLAQLNPFRRQVTHTLTYGNQELRGMHANNIALVYQLNREAVQFSATVSHIWCNDGFNALWSQQGTDIDNTLFVYTWGNEGKRRAYSFEPQVKWQVCQQTSLDARATLMWDKRIAETISMDKEHWGINAQIGVNQQFDKCFLFNAHASYAEGNTVDLYSHEARSYKIGTFLNYKTEDGAIEARVAYDYAVRPQLVITQGVNPEQCHIPAYGWVGNQYVRPNSRHNLLASITYHF
ncbi:MAG: outer membrane beta-barrel protein [Bacteroidales bacterium]|nr:outer membrane beta-barrel protein [Bacteroidales bacterium]